MRMRALWLIEGVRLPEPLRLGPLTLSPVPLEDGYLGKELREVFNAQLAAASFETRVQRPIWGAQIAPYHRLVAAVSDEFLVPSLQATGLLHHLAGRAIDVLGLVWGGAPEVFAAAVEFVEDTEEWRPLAVSVGGGPWQASVLRKLLHDEQALPDDQPTAIWEAIRDRTREALWLSLARDLARERVWDRRIFRACSLLETMATEVAPPNTVVTDDQGAPLLNRQGEQATTGLPRARTYWALRRSITALGLDPGYLLAHPSRSLWDEIGVWFDVRNMVAHKGFWPAPPAATQRRARRDAVAEAFATAARGDDLAGGWLRYADTAVAAVETVVRAGLGGAFDE